MPSLVSSIVVPFEYHFEREKVEWDPEFSAEGQLHPTREIRDEVVLEEARGGNRATRGWQLVKGLVRRGGSAREKDEAALKLAAPDSGSFVLVSLRRRRKDRVRDNEKD